LPLLAASVNLLRTLIGIPKRFEGLHADRAQNIRIINEVLNFIFGF
jgi:hypothetical protein